VLNESGAGPARAIREWQGQRDTVVRSQRHSRPAEGVTHAGPERTRHDGTSALLASVPKAATRPSKHLTSS